MPRVHLAVLVLSVLLLAPFAAEAQPSRAGWPRQVTIGSASIGGVYFVLAGGWAKVIQDKMSMPSSVEVTGGPVQNIQLLQAKRIELGMTTMGPAVEGYNGVGGPRLTDIRVAFPMYTSYAHFITRADSGIRSIRDLNGKVVDLGPRGGSAEFVGTRALQAFNVRPRRIVHLSFQDGANNLRDGLVDANFGVIGLPVPAWQELSLTRPVRFFGFSRDEIQELVERFPWLTRANIRAGVYRGQDYIIDTVTMWNAAMVNKDAPDTFAYELVKTMFDNRDFLATVHPVANEMLPVNLFYINLPLHPGALRYYQERNVRIKESQMPPR